MAYVIGAVVLMTFLFAFIAFTGSARRGNLYRRTEKALSSGQIEETLYEFIQEGQKLAAVKLIREACGIGLKEAKEFVDKRFAGQDVSLPPLVSQSPKGAPAPAPLPEATSPSEEVRKLYLAGKKIAAIKLYREETGVGLREAKEMVESIDS